MALLGACVLAQVVRLRRFHLWLYQTKSVLLTSAYQSNNLLFALARDWLVSPLAGVPPVSRLLATIVAGHFGFPLKRLKLKIRANLTSPDMGRTCVPLDIRRSENPALATPVACHGVINIAHAIKSARPIFAAAIRCPKTTVSVRGRRASGATRKIIHRTKVSSLPRLCEKSHSWTAQ